MKTIYKESNNDVRWENAYNEYGTLINVKEAEKILEGKKNKFFLYSDLSFEMVLRTGSKNIKHFALKSEIEINGVTYKTGNVNGETIYHYEAKVKTARNLYFFWSNYKVYFQEPKIERILEGSKYRADLVAKLECGTKITIEIVYSSDISHAKRKFIKEKQLPTFIIYLDKNGNQDYERFDFIGNDKIEQLSSRIRKGKDSVLGIISERNSKQRKLFDRESQDRKRLRELESRIRSEVERKEGELFQVEGGNYFGSGKIKEDIERLRNRISEIERISRKFDYDIRDQERKIKSIKSNTRSIEGIGKEIKELENTFIQVAKVTPWEWVAPSYIAEPRGENRLSMIKYFCE